MPGYGIGFQPGQDKGQGSGTAEPPPLESVVKLLSLRLPSVVGARGIAPQALLNAPGMAGAGMSGGMGEQQWLQILQRLLSGQGGGMGPQTMGLPGGTADPRIIPGSQKPPIEGPFPLPVPDRSQQPLDSTGRTAGNGGPLTPRGPVQPFPLDGLLER